MNTHHNIEDTAKAPDVGDTRVVRRGGEQLRRRVGYSATKRAESFAFVGAREAEVGELRDAPPDKEQDVFAFDVAVAVFVPVQIVEREQHLSHVIVCQFLTEYFPVLYKYNTNTTSTYTNTNTSTPEHIYPH